MESLPEVNVIRPRIKRLDIFSSGEESMLGTGFYLLLEEIQKVYRYENGFLRLMDILLRIAAIANYKHEFTIWGCYFMTFEGLTYGIFITPPLWHSYTQIVSRLIKHFGVHDLSYATNMPEEIVPLITKKPDGTIIRYWPKDWYIPDFYSQVTKLPRNQFLYITKMTDIPEHYETLEIDHNKFQVENVLFNLAN